MSKKIIALLLAGGLAVGLCGCGGSSCTSLPPESVTEDDLATVETVEEVLPEEPDDPEPEILEDSGIVEVENEGSLTYIDELQESEGSGDESSVMGIDVGELLTTHILEREDYDGYQFRETIRLSPIFRESDFGTLIATWEALGGNANEIPVGEDCYNWDSKLQRSLERSGFSGAQYIIGSWEILNRTEGFDFTPDSPRTLVSTMYMKPDDNGLPLGVYEAISQCSMTCVFFSDEPTMTKSDMAILSLGNALMSENQWGPTLFIIILPDKVSPNLPNGYDCHNLLFDFGFYLSGNEFYIPYYGELN